MKDYFVVQNFQIPNELKSLYEAISKEFEKRVYDADRLTVGNKEKENSENYRSNE